jgi:hypothetical protein
MMGTFHPTYASLAWVIKSTLMLVHTHKRLFRAIVVLMAWKWIWLTRFQSRDLRSLLALMSAIVPHREGQGSGSRPSGNHPYVQGSHGSSCEREVAPSGRYARPDRNGGVYQPDKIFIACPRTGHVAANCNNLAIVLFIKKYKQQILDNMKKWLKSEWVKHWTDSLGNPLPA